MLAIVLALAAVAAAGPVLSHGRLNSVHVKHEVFDTRSFSLCDAFGFDNDLACLFCSVEELMPLMHADNLNALPASLIASSAACIKNLCDACNHDAACLTVNKKSLLPICNPASAMSQTISLSQLSLSDSQSVGFALISKPEPQLQESGSGSGLDASGSGASGSGSDMLILMDIHHIEQSGSGASGSGFDASGSGDLPSGSGLDIASGSGASGSGELPSAFFVELSGSGSSGSGSSGSGSSGSGDLAEYLLTDALPFSGSSGSGSGDVIPALELAAAAPALSTSTTPQPFTVTPPPSQLPEDHVLVSQNITLHNVNPLKFKVLYVIAALAATFNLTTDVFYAQVNNNLVAAGVSSISMTYDVVVCRHMLASVQAEMNGLVNSSFVANLQAQNPKLFADVTVDASPVIVSGDEDHMHFPFFIMAGVVLAAVCAIALIVLVLVAAKKRQTIARASQRSEKAYIKYDLVPTYEVVDVPPPYLADSSDEELLA